MVIRDSLSACPAEPGRLARLQGGMRERHGQELLVKPRREEKGAGLEGKTSR